jgi:thioredoxin-like negative regulator of GroEL
VRVRAATALGVEARPTLLAVAHREDGDDMAAGRAIATLGETLPTDEVKAILAHALRARREVTASECLASLGRRAEPTTIPVLAKVLAIEKGELAVAAARALAATGLVAAEAPLLATLARDVPDLRVVAASALGQAGSAAAVLPLREAEARFKDDATRRAARQAVAEILSRLPGASAGQVSLAAPDTGALSLADDASGRLTLDVNRKQQ